MSADVVVANHMHHGPYRPRIDSRSCNCVFNTTWACAWLQLWKRQNVVAHTAARSKDPALGKVRPQVQAFMPGMHRGSTSSIYTYTCLCTHTHIYILTYIYI